jgi:hypothetical protein
MTGDDRAVGEETVKAKHRWEWMTNEGGGDRKEATDHQRPTDGRVD